MIPSYPIYIVSKGRAKSRLTSKALEHLKVPYRIVIEPQEYEQYAAVIDKAKILTLPFSNLGQGSIPARNWIWEHSRSEGAARHWILDDNIRCFFRLYRNAKIIVDSGTIFKVAEIFVDRYTNIAIAGFNYDFFCKSTVRLPPYYRNTRIYSCILIKNDIPYRWRGKYNEDTDLSLCALKNGWCTILFNAFLAGKEPTMRMAGGNTDELYANEGRKLMAEALAAAHPDVARVTWKFGRIHHQVNYSGFRRNHLVRKPNLFVPGGNNEYGMVLLNPEGHKNLDAPLQYVEMDEAARVAESEQPLTEEETEFVFDAELEQLAQMKQASLFA